MLTDLYKLRTEKGLSQKQLAKLSGVSKSAILQIESGKSIPRIDTVALLAHTLEMSPGDLTNILLDGEDYQ